MDFRLNWFETCIPGIQTGDQSFSDVQSYKPLALFKATRHEPYKATAINSYLKLKYEATCNARCYANAERRQLERCINHFCILLFIYSPFKPHQKSKPS